MSRLGGSNLQISKTSEKTGKLTRCIFKQVKGMALTAPCQLTSDGRADRFSPSLTAFPRFFEEIREKKA